VRVSLWFERFGYAPVLDELVVGAYPLDRADVERIAGEGVDRIYNLCQDAEYADGERAGVAAALREHGIEEERLPLVDYGGLGPEVLERAVSDVLEALDDGSRVYLHCRAGWQRSAAVAAGVIALREDLPVEDALRVLRERKPTAEPMDHQRADLLAWFSARRRR
jgi:atypical dual specificity phosphatase